MRGPWPKTKNESVLKKGPSLIVTKKEKGGLTMTKEKQWPSFLVLCDLQHMSQQAHNELEGEKAIESSKKQHPKHTNNNKDHHEELHKEQQDFSINYDQ